MALLASKSSAYFIGIAYFCGLAGIAIWYMLRYLRNRRLERPAIGDAVRPPGQPHISEGSLTHIFPRGLSSGAVIVDLNAGLIHFKNCHSPRKFWSWAQPWFSCPITDIEAVHVFSDRVCETLTIVTATGKAVILCNGTDYLELMNKLKELVPYNQPGFATDNPMMSDVILAGAFVGIVAGVAFAAVLPGPWSSYPSVMALGMLGGGSLGVFGIYMLVYLGDGWLQIEAVQPIGFAMVGATAGLSVGSLLGGGGENMGLILAIVAVGIASGGVFGAVKVSGERKPPR